MVSIFVNNLVTWPSVSINFIQTIRFELKYEHFKNLLFIYVKF